ncbi:MAG: M28 family peptidase [Candidatus Obscuribacterales bacterium]
MTDNFKEGLSKRLREHVVVLASEIGCRSLTSAPVNLELAAAYIEHKFSEFGYLVDKQEYDVELLSSKSHEEKNDTLVFPKVTHTTRNIVAEIKGSDHPEQIVVIGAHYDSVYDCPAANDNGSGVSAILELARHFANRELPCTVRFVAFTNEEPPFFHTDKMGSYQYAKLCHERKDNIVAMLSLETIGYYSDSPGSQSFPNPLLRLLCPDTGNFLLFLSNLKSQALLKRTLRSFRAGVKFPSQGISLPEFISGVRFSDQDSFWRFGYPALMITDTANYRYPHYHDKQDTPEKLNYEKLAEVLIGLIRVVEELTSHSSKV